MSGSEATGNRPKILIADDNVQNVELLEVYLEELDCDIVKAYDGEETLEVIAREKPDLVLLDIMMPKISGYEICRKLKGDPAAHTLPILMVTALNESSDVERAIQAGADDFISKPIHKDDLIRRVRALLRVRDEADDLQRTLEYITEIDEEPASRQGDA